MCVLLISITYNPARKFSLTFGLGEWLWYMSGSDRVNPMLYYNKNYLDYSDDGCTLNGAYGKRIFGCVESNTNQFNNVLAKLRDDPDSRQAVIALYTAQDSGIQSKDIPCTCSLQFLIRNNRLNLLVYMRSNDLIWGMPYDIFSFTLIQEYLANLLNIEIGWYEHVVGSMHIYSYHYNLARDILACNTFPKFSMPSLNLNDLADFKNLQISEMLLRTTAGTDLPVINNYLLKNFQSILCYLKYRKAKNYKDQQLVRSRLDKAFQAVLS